MNKYDNAIRDFLRSERLKAALDGIVKGTVQDSDNLLIEQQPTSLNALLDTIRYRRCSSDSELQAAYNEYRVRAHEESGLTRDHSTGAKSLGMDNSEYRKMVARAQAESAYCKRSQARF